MSGMAILMPLVLTMMIMSFLINFLTQPFLKSTQRWLEQSFFFQDFSFLFHQVLLSSLFSKALILLALTSLILLVGLLGKLFLVNLLFRLGDNLLYRLPFINKIYTACQDVVQSLFSSSSKKFSQVVLVPFPHPESLSLGLVTNESIRLDNCQQETDPLISVFIPGTPNPSVGFILMLKREQLLFVNMKVEEAMKFIISCGVFMPNFEIFQP